MSESESVAPDAATPSPSAPAGNPRARRFWLRSLAAVVVLGAAAAGAWYVLEARWYESTDDAYVQGHIALVSAAVPGTVIKVRVNDGDHVTAGQVLAELDDAQTRLNLSTARAALVNAVRQVQGMQTQIDGSSAQLTAAEKALQSARQELARRQRLAPSGAISAEELAHARDVVTQAESQLATVREQLRGHQVRLGDTPIEQNPDVEVAAAHLRKAWLDTQRTRIIAPVDGFVARRNVEPGQNINVGQPLMAVVPLQAVWVDANFKETQLGSLRLGQPVSLVADVYGSKVTYKAEIASLGVGTGSAFSVLPAQNATGNWIKIVQRIPVQVRFTDPEQLTKHPLRIGMSVAVDVDIHDQSGAVLTAAGATRPSAGTDVFARQLAEADTLVQQVIRENAAADATEGESVNPSSVPATQGTDPTSAIAHPAAGRS